MPFLRSQIAPALASTRGQLSESSSCDPFADHETKVDRAKRRTCFGPLQFASMNRSADDLNVLCVRQSRALPSNLRYRGVIRIHIVGVRFSQSKWRGAAADHAVGRT